MQELTELLEMLDDLLHPAGWSNELRDMQRDDMKKLRAWIVAITKRVELLEDAQRMREGEL